MTDFEEARNYLNHVTGFAKKTSLSNVQWILDVLGNPEKDLFMIHVAGTNGKGSVCAFLDSILTGAGIRLSLIHIYSCGDQTPVSRER